ncbi:MAG TPA: hypothetical protein VFQ88_02145 [Nevskiaceae bacterium]|nr:hypothetical protein [Nevskiaceae bacterium]
MTNRARGNATTEGGGRHFADAQQLAVLFAQASCGLCHLSFYIYCKGHCYAAECRYPGVEQQAHSID